MSDKLADFTDNMDDANISLDVLLSWMVERINTLEVKVKTLENENDGKYNDPIKG